MATRRNKMERKKNKMEQKENKVKDHPALLFKKDRLETFKSNWKVLGFKNCTPEKFAAAGFYNCDPHLSSDIVRCFSCQKELGDWEEGDDPWSEHVRRCTDCPFVLLQRKQQQTLEDFLELQFKIKRNLLNNYFEEQKKALIEKGEELLGAISKCSKSK